MNTNIQKTICLSLIVGLTLILGSLFAISAYADDPISMADVDAATDYFSGNNTPQVPVTPPNNYVPTGPRGAAGGLGGIANNLMEPVAVVASFMVSVALIAGFTCLLAGFLRYMQHRANPLAHPISTVIILLVLGTMLLLLPLIYKFTESGIPFGYY